MRQLKVVRNGQGTSTIWTCLSFKSELPWDTADGAEVEGRWIIIKSSLQTRQNEFVLLWCRSDKTKATWCREAMANAIRRRNQCWRICNNARNQHNWMQYAKLGCSTVKLVRVEKQVWAGTICQMATEKYYAYKHPKSSLRGGIGRLKVKGQEITDD